MTQITNHGSFFDVGNIEPNLGQKIVVRAGFFWLPFKVKNMKKMLKLKTIFNEAIVAKMKSMESKLFSHCPAC